MTRSSWKGPFVDGYLLRKAEARVEKISLNPNGQPTGTEPLDVED